MFNKTHFNQLASNTEKEDYLNQFIIGPARTEARQTLAGMTQRETSDAFKAFDVHYLGALEAKMVSAIVMMTFDTYQIDWN